MLERGIPMAGAAVILLSRQARRPCATTSWLVQTARAVDHLAQQGLRLNSSIGLSTWEMITTLGSRAKMPMTLFLVVNSTEHFNQLKVSTLETFALDPKLVDFVPITADTTKDKSAAMQVRDRIIIEKSRLLVPISVRENGTMARRLERPGPNHDIDPTFRTDYVAESTACAEDYSTLSLSPDIDATSDGYLFHWTRAADQAWPGERLFDYYTEIRSSQRYPRLAFDTLLRIATTRTLIASREHMPGRTATVAFSSLPPSKVVPLMTWRARYGRMSFEPYAIGVSSKTVEDLGILPVHYYDKRDKRSIADLPPWQTQSRGEITDWQTEQEHRHLGNLELKRLAKKDLLLICRLPGEVATLEAATGIRTEALFADK